MCFLSFCLVPTSNSHWPHFNLCKFWWCSNKSWRFSAVKSQMLQRWFDIVCLVKSPLLLLWNMHKLHLKLETSWTVFLWVFSFCVERVLKSQKSHFKSGFNSCFDLMCNSRYVAELYTLLHWAHTCFARVSAGILGVDCTTAALGLRHYGFDLILDKKKIQYQS